MKRNILIGVCAVALLLFGSFMGDQVSAQKNGQKRVARTDSPSSLSFTEDFSYTAATILTNNGWLAHSGAGTNSPAVTTPGLSYTGYAGSGVGNATTLTTSGEDVNRTFTPITSGSVYTSFMVNVASTQVTGDYFFHIVEGPIASNLFRGRVFVKKDAVTNNFAFGIQKGSTVNTVYTGTTYVPGTTYLVVIKYTFVAGALNDTVDMFINPTLGGAEPAPTVSAVVDTTVDSVDIQAVALRQGSAANAGAMTVDGIRVGTAWADVSGSAVAAKHIFDYDGDGKTDYTVVRNTGGGPQGQVTWFTRLNTGALADQRQWGIATDFFVGGDYDGDHKTDIAVWRPGAAFDSYFYIFQSATNTVRVDNFGQTGDNPEVVGDYDGDGKDDVAIYRAGANSGDPSFWWYTTSAGGPQNVVRWGQNGDFVAPGDYDGDGKADFCIQRNAGGGQANFFTLLATGTQLPTFRFGTPTDVIVPGDYDGDGKTDIATIRGSGGVILWWILPSSTGVIPTQPIYFGASATDFVCQGDYDGDGKVEPAIWRPNADPNANFFWSLGAVSGPIAVEWGQNGDYPVANSNSH